MATKVVVVTQDEGDPANQGFGYFPIDLGRLSRAAVSFTLRLRFIRSSYGTPECSPPGPPEILLLVRRADDPRLRQARP